MSEREGAQEMTEMWQIENPNTGSTWKAEMTQEQAIHEEQAGFTVTLIPTTEQRTTLRRWHGIGTD